MEKKQIIDYINNQHKGHLTKGNTSYSSINKSKAVWWFNIPVTKFEKDVHLLLGAKDHSLWVTLPKGFVHNLPANFKIREDKHAVDLEIWADDDDRYLHDVKSGGQRFNFSPYLKETIHH